MEHKRLEYDITDLIADIGGIQEILTKTTGFFLGGYLAFNASLVIIDELYGGNKEANAIIKKATQLIRDSEASEIEHEGGEKF